jgi:flagellar hook-associated protein 1
MSIGSILNMARSGMNAQQLAVQVASQNISNAQTAGYSKQTVVLTSALPTVFPYGSVGTGVDVETISRARDAMLDAQYRQDAAGQSYADTKSSALTQIQSVFGEPSDNGLSASLDAFWSAWDNLSTNPTDSAAKSVVRETGANLASTFNRVASQIDDLDQSNREAMNADVAQVNSLSSQIATYNTQISGAESGGNSANDLRDARDKLVDQITSLTGGQVVQRSNGNVAVYVAGRLIVDGASSNPLQMNDGQPPTVSYSGSASPLAGMGGSLGAKIDLSTTSIPNILNRLDALAGSVVTNVNAVHSTGQTFTGNPPVAAAAGNFFDVTTPPPAGGDPLLTARNMRLSSTLTDASKVAAAGATATGPGNNDAATALAGLRNASVAIKSPSGVTVDTNQLSGFYDQLVGDIATSTQQASDDSTVQATLTSNADTRRQSVSGVSTDEELIDIIQHQHSYQAAARLVTVVDDMAQTLIDLGR